MHFEQINFHHFASCPLFELNTTFFSLSLCRPLSFSLSAVFYIKSYSVHTNIISQCNIWLGSFCLSVKYLMSNIMHWNSFDWDNDQLMTIRRLSQTNHTNTHIRSQRLTKWEERVAIAITIILLLLLSPQNHKPIGSFPTRQSQFIQSSRCIIHLRLNHRWIEKIGMTDGMTKSKSINFVKRYSCFASFHIIHHGLI